jgi:uncharacterized membrane protein
MFGDMAMITIWVSINTAIMMLMIFMYYIGKASHEGNHQEAMVYEKRAD